MRPRICPLLVALMSLTTLVTSCIDSTRIATSELQRAAAATPITTIDDVVKEFIAGMESAFLQVQLASDVRWQHGQFSARISSRCALEVEASIINDLTVRTRGSTCKGIEILAGTPRILSLNEIKWNLERNSFWVRSPNWAADGLLAAVSPLINSILAPRLPRSVKELKDSFNLRNPEAILSALVPLLTGQRDPTKVDTIADRLRDVHFRYSSRLSNAMRIKLVNADLFLYKDSILEVAITLSGSHRAPLLERIVLATPVGTIASTRKNSRQSSIARIVDTFSVGVVTQISIDQLGNYSVLAGSLVTQPEEWPYRYNKSSGNFAYSGQSKSKGIVNDLIAKEAPKMLMAFRTFLKQTQPSIPLFLPKDLFSNL